VAARRVVHARACHRAARGTSARPADPSRQPWAQAQHQTLMFTLPLPYSLAAPRRYAALVATLPTWWERVAFFAVSHAGFSVIHLQARRAPASFASPQLGVLVCRTVSHDASAAFAALQTCELCIMCFKRSFEPVT